MSETNKVYVAVSNSYMVIDAIENKVIAISKVDVENDDEAIDYFAALYPENEGKYIFVKILATNWPGGTMAN